MRSRPERHHTHDLALAAKVATAALVSWVVPERAWDPLTRFIGRVVTRSAARWDGGRTDVRTVRRERIAAGHSARLYGLREYRPFGPRPRISLTGAEHVHAAQARGRGVILWIARFAYASLIAKVALHRAGFEVSHLSRPTHGFAMSPFAVRWLNPVWTRIEERYVRERIVMQPGAETAALRALRQRLAENRIVSIAVGDEGRQTVTVPFLDLELCIATGPVHVAVSSGGALLPVITIREGSAFAVEIQPPLDVPQDRSGANVAVAAQYAARLEPWVRAHPGQWLG